jgi:hypothetical protein
MDGAGTAAMPMANPVRSSTSMVKAMKAWERKAWTPRVWTASGSVRGTGTQSVPCARRRGGPALPATARPLPVTRGSAVP